MTGDGWQVCIRCVELGFGPGNSSLHQTRTRCEGLLERPCEHPEEHHSPVWRKRHRLVARCEDCGQVVDPFDYGECKP